MTIATWISGVWPETEQRLRERPVVGYDAQRDRAVTSAIAEVYATATPNLPPPSGSALDDADPLIQELIAWLAVLRLIPLARDVYMQEALSTNESYQPGGSGGVSYYNKIEALDALAADLRERSAARLPLVVQRIRGSLGRPPAPRPTFFTLARGGRGR